MRTFHLYREVDESGVSGTGIVAEGVMFSNCWVALHWLKEYTCVNIYPSIAEVMAIHGHGGKTKVLWDDEMEVVVVDDKK